MDVKKLAIGFGMFLAFTVAANMIVRPLAQKAAKATNVPILGALI